jgi:protein TonB
MVQVEANRDRLRAALGVAAFHALLGYALITGLRYDVTNVPGESLRIFHVSAPVPPPPQSTPDETKTHTPEGAASAPSRKSNPTPVVAPKPKVKLEANPPLAAVPEPTPVPTGSDPSAGVANVDGPGSGTGGTGFGTGSGGQGSGSGSGGARRALRLSGRLSNEDYPSSAVRSGAQGSVSVRYTVAPGGRVEDCTVTRSSGHKELDRTTCRLIEARFRYRPATDLRGNPVPDQVSRTFDWLLPFRRDAQAAALRD